MISIDTKKKELAGLYAQKGREWRPRGDPRRVRDHDFPEPGGGKAIPARLLVTCDAGGSNGYRARAWKAELAALAAGTGLEITCCHFPPGTSRWNRIEVRHEAPPLTG